MCHVTLMNFQSHCYGRQMQLCNRTSGLIQINRLVWFALTLKSNESMNCRFVSLRALCVLNSFFFFFFILFRIWPQILCAYTHRWVVCLFLSARCFAHSRAQHTWRGTVQNPNEEWKPTYENSNKNYVIHKIKPKVSIVSRFEFRSGHIQTG